MVVSLFGTLIGYKKTELPKKQLAIIGRKMSEGTYSRAK